eukprot:COSAG01_NODE_4264_length_5198_cov_3.619337_3_plen_313_part_00
MCERAEQVLEEGGGVEQLAQHLMGADDATLTVLSQRLCSVESLTADGASTECLATVTAALDELVRCADPVVGASRALELAEHGDRARALVVLASLPRVALEVAVEAEVGAATAVLKLLACSAEPEPKSVSAWMSVFALSLRNGPEAMASIVQSETAFDASLEYVCQLGTGELDGSDGVLLVGAVTAVGFPGLSWELGPKTRNLELREAMASKAQPYFAQINGRCFASYTAERMKQLLPSILDAMASEDSVLAAGITTIVGYQYAYNRHADAVDQCLSPAVLDAALALRTKVSGGAQETTAAWWAARAEVTRY